MSDVVVYEWLTSRQFLAWVLFPEAVGRQASPDDTVESVLAGLPADARFFLFHLNCTASVPGRCVSYWPPAPHDFSPRRPSPRVP